MENKIIKYIFIAIVVILIVFGIYQVRKDDSEILENSLDKTSTVNNIQKNLRFAICNFDTINPINSDNRNVQEISKIIYEPLITLNNNYKMEYCLASEIAKVDELSYVIKLKDNVKWHDGSYLTSDDVKYTVDLIKSNSASIYYENIEAVSGLEIIDEHTVKIYLFNKVDFFEYNLTFPILKRNCIEEDNFTIGTGIFKISTLDSNIIKLEKNNEYWNSSRNPMAEEININLYGSVGEMYTAFKNGDIDILNIKINNIEDYIGTLGYKEIEYRSREYNFIALNNQNRALSSSVVRKAISKMIDKNNIVASCLGSGYVSSNFSLDMGQWLYTKDINIEQNTDEAFQILTDDGWQYKNNKWSKIIDGIYTELSFYLTVNSDDEKNVQVAENIKNQLANWGINITIRYVNGENYTNVLKNKNYDMILAGINCGYSPNLSTFFGEDNLANYSNDEMREILNVVSETTDENTLYEKYNRIYEIYLEEAPYIGLYRSTDVVVCNQDFVGNVQANAFNVYYNIEKWYRQ